MRAHQQLDPTTGIAISPILIVEDDAQVRETICWVLEDEGMVVELAGDGREALDRARRRKPALVLLDMGLPLIDGEGVAAGLRDTYGDGVRILVMTADGRAREKARRVGAFDYLHKPFGIDDLVQAVRRALDQA